MKKKRNITAYKCKKKKSLSNGFFGIKPINFGFDTSICIKEKKCQI